MVKMDFMFMLRFFLNRYPMTFILISFILLLGCRAHGGAGYADDEKSSFLGVGSSGLYGSFGYSANYSIK